MTHFLVLSATFLAVSPLAFGQATFGSLIGTVADPAGAVVTGAKVTVHSEERGVTYNAATNDSGNYFVTQLSVGSYRVEFEAPGFQRVVQTEVRVALGTSTRVDAQLSVGQVNEQVNVTGSAPPLVTDRAEVSTALTTKEVRDLPTLNRNITSLQLLIPGSQRVLGQHASSENPQGGIQINNNGQTFGSTNFMIDGTDNNDPVLGIVIVNPSIDSVKEVKYTGGNFDAEFAQAGGAVIQVETKSGTNELHGSLFHFLQNNIMNARNPFSEPNGPPPLRWNQFGGSLGGPVLKNKLFVFGDYQGTRRRTGASVLTTVPTAAIRNGDFSAFTERIFDPLTGDGNGAGRVPFPGNRIPIDRISPQARALINLLPLPNAGAPGAINNNFTAQDTDRYDADQFDVRVDHHVSNSFRYFSRYSFADFRRVAPAAFGQNVGGPGLSGLLFSGQAPARNQNAVGGFNYIVSPTLLTDVRFGYTQYKVNVLPLDFGRNTAQEAGIPNVNLPDRPDTSGLPSLEVTGNGAFRFGYSLQVNQCNCPLDQREFVYQFVNNWTRIAGNHMLKWGTDVRRAQNRRLPSDRKRNGNFTFAPTVTGAADAPGSGVGAATFLLGMPSLYERFVLNATDMEDMQWRMFYFAQDTWRITSKLTLSLGLRWDTWFPNQSINEGQGSRYDVTTNSVILAGVGENSKSANVKTQWANLSPRLAIAYQFNPKTVVRTGWGRSYFQEIFGNTFNNTANNYPTLITQTVQQPNLYTPVFTLAEGAPTPVVQAIPANGILPLPDRVGASYRPDDIKYSYVDSWNFSIERLLTSDMTATATYVGNTGRHLRIGWPLNQAIAGPGLLNPRRPLFVRYGLTQGITDASNMGSNSYQALQTKITKRFSQGVSLLGTYTWSKSIDTAGGLMLNGRLNRGIANFDRTHVGTIGINAEIPVGRGRRFLSDSHRAVNLVLGGWELSSITLLQSGLAITPQLVNNGHLNADVGGESLRPDRIVDVDLYDVPGGQSRERWFNLSAFRVPGQYQFGTASRGSLRGPGLINVDFSLAKRFAVDERRSFQLRGEAFNAFNHTNLANPNTQIDSGPSNAARITGILVGTTMRVLQIGLRFDF
ncbi:MAG: carboxypeptidase regulatory-like domain-containing protein [Bryobacteraceae bacterium]